MPTLVALLRGINVGKAKRVAMADLRKLVERLGYGDVRTLLNSGNVVFSAPSADTRKAAARIEQALLDATGVSARVVVLTAAELEAAVKGNPLLEVAADPARLLAAFLADPADRSKIEPLRARKWGREALGVGPRVAYLWCADGILKSALLEEVWRAVGGGLTTRNWATVLKLHALAGGGPATPPAARTRGG